MVVFCNTVLFVIIQTKMEILAVGCTKPVNKKIKGVSYESNY